MRTISIIIVLFVISSCTDNRYPGYSKTNTGIYFKLMSVGENEYQPNPGDYITADIIYKTIKDSVFFSARRRFQLTNSEYQGGIEECFAMLAQGEKGLFMISADDFFSKTLSVKRPTFIEAESPMKVEITIITIQTVQQYENEKSAFLKWIDDFGEYEKELLSQYIKDNKIHVKPTESGMIFIKTKPGNGRKVKKGDTIIVEYEGRFLDGKFFDSTIKRRESFSYVYGTEWQVVEGLDEAFGMMEEGEKAVVILPSDMAFGDEGSSTGIIPPFTSLIFEVEMKKVN